MYKSISNGDVIKGNKLVRDNSMDDIDIKSYSVCHDQLISTAFLITSYDYFKNIDYQLLFFSDTGPNSTQSNCSWVDKINDIWRDDIISLNTLKLKILN
jgi:hypothetical protein